MLVSRLTTCVCGDIIIVMELELNWLWDFEDSTEAYLSLYKLLYVALVLRFHFRHI